MSKRNIEALEEAKGNDMTMTVRAILVRIMTAVFVIGILVIMLGTPNKPQTVKLSTYNASGYYDVKTLRPIENVPHPGELPTTNTQEPADTLRIEFIGIENGWIELEGPKEHADRVAIAKKFAVAKGILTKEELKFFTPYSLENIGNRTIIRYENPTNAR